MAQIVRVRYVLKSFCVVFAFLIGLLFVTPQLHADSGTKSEGKLFFWEVRSDTATVYLLGSIHAFKKSMYPLDRTIEEAYEKSDVMVVEMDITGIKEIQITRAMQQAGMYTGDESLEDNITAETHMKLTHYLKSQGISFQQISKNKPWFLNLGIAGGEIMKLGYDPKYGIDRHFMDKAKGVKPIMDLETLDEQIHILSGGTKEEEDRLLRMTLKDLPELPELIKRMVTVWMDGDADGLIGMELERTNNYAGLEAFLDRVFYDRNYKMARKIKKLLKTDKSYFVVIGALHMGGDKGIVKLLQDGNYKVKQLSRSSRLKVKTSMIYGPFLTHIDLEINTCIGWYKVC